VSLSVQAATKWAAARAIAELRSHRPRPDFLASITTRLASMNSRYLLLPRQTLGGGDTNTRRGAGLNKTTT